MPKLRTSTIASLTLMVAIGCNGPSSAMPSVPAQGTVEKTVPQGEDPPGADDDLPAAPLEEHNGVITPPPIGDEEIHTDVPNPDAGHEEEVIPPPGMPGGTPNVDPR